MTSTSASATCSSRGTAYTNPTSTVTPTRTELLSTVVVASFNGDCARRRTPGRLARPGKSKGTRIATNEKNLLSAIKAVYGWPNKEGTAVLSSADGSTLLAEKTQILQRWAKHFRGVLNRRSTITDAAIARWP
ncbi:hypothetical protein SprV_0401696400 [Sparganum proliferum]